MADIRRTGVIDDFTRANESPLGGPPASNNWWKFMDHRFGEMELAGNLAGDKYTTDPGNGLFFSHWTGTNGAPAAGSLNGDCEVWGTPTGGGLGAAGEGWRLAIVKDVGLGTNQFDGYVFYWFHALGDGYGAFNYTNGSPSAPGSFNVIGPSAGGDRYLFRRNGNDLEGWVSYDSGANWTLALSWTDTTYMTGMSIGIGVEDPTHGGVGWDAIGGGAPRRKRPQIYRWITN